MTAEQPYVEIDGDPAAAGKLLFPALVNYGHYTSMQVRAGAVRGLGLHLDRLDSATRELFGAELPADLVRGRIRHALRGRADASVRVVVFSPQPAGAAGPVSVLVSVTGPQVFDPRPRRLRSVPYQRPAAHLKHVGSFGQTYHGIRVRREGFDDALLTTAAGVISETATANIGFRDGDAVLWPDAPALAGITMRLLEQVLADRGVAVRRRALSVSEAVTLPAAFVTSSLGIAPVERVDDRRLPVDEPLMATLNSLYDAVPGDPV
ncbi:aminotransferase class IV [Catellatospora sp. KI3]|uniref:aminotransferase class IV n=1 Tax=Catellatospora sp. KI3 TaxID=3041620 RepID=UPI00248317AC|nr:aminotransferase class IV [Catellatospora sp. KI3]MDI1461490.1 aminotransferase class IV [Catellatospora sp. KI3]